ncbi:MAG: hypothetical protein Q8N04_16430 [Nitrospira sp.]|nr:hypothetical protein [Nitrospira sp.]
MRVRAVNYPPRGRAIQAGSGVSAEKLVPNEHRAGSIGLVPSKS